MGIFHQKNSVVVAGLEIRLDNECVAMGNQEVRCPGYAIRWQQVEKKHLESVIRQAFLTAEKTQPVFRRKQLVAMFNGRRCSLFHCTSGAAARNQQIWFWLADEGTMIQIDFGHQKPDASRLPTALRNSLYWQDV